MSNRPDEFAQLRRLLAAKKQEQPPPGYFEHFSERVIRRIEHDDPMEENSRWQWFLGFLSAKPVLACAYGGFVAATLLIGFRVSERLDPAPALHAETLPWLASTGEVASVFSSRPPVVLSGSSFAIMRSPLPPNGATFAARVNELALEPVSFASWTRP